MKNKMNKKRKQGFYWVFIDNIWTVGCYYSFCNKKKRWVFTGREKEWSTKLLKKCGGIIGREVK